MGAGKSGSMVMGVFILVLLLQIDCTIGCDRALLWRCMHSWGESEDVCRHLTDCPYPKHFRNSDVTIGCDKALLWRCMNIWRYSEDECRHLLDCPYPKHFHNSGEPSTVELCTSGCSSSICSIIITVDGTEAGKQAAVERCNEACTRFCSKGALGIESVTA